MTHHIGIIEAHMYWPVHNRWLVAVEVVFNPITVAQHCITACHLPAHSQPPIPNRLQLLLPMHAVTQWPPTHHNYSA